MIKKILFILLSALVFVSCSAKIISPSGNSSIESEGNDQSGGGTLPTEEELIAKYAIDIGLEDTEISQKIEENLKAYYEEMGTYRVIFTGIPKDYMGGAESLSSLVYEAAKKAAADKVDVDIRNIDFKDGAIESYMFAEGLDSQAPFVLNFIFPENTITTIKTLAFNMLSSLKEITIPSSVTMIEDSAFSYCSQLEKLVFEEGITTIWASSFP
ncbi:leucine-rich repeat protein [Brachyspira sp. G79]|uniref:leucine-rich repeat protein n=1 Tax=Brachyspira sp. G79 TaxID=1358104 RepID=UPI0026C573C1